MGNEHENDRLYYPPFAVQPATLVTVGAAVVAAAFGAFVSYAWVPAWSWTWALWHGLWASLGAGVTMAVAMLRLPFTLRLAELAVIGGAWFLWQPAATPGGAAALIMPFIGWAAAVYLAALAPSYVRPQHTVTATDDVQTRLDEFYFELYVYGAHRRQRAPHIGARRAVHLLCLMLVAWGTAPMYGIGFSAHWPGPAVGGLAVFLLGALMWLAIMETNTRLFAWHNDDTVTVGRGGFHRWGLSVGLAMLAVIVLAFLVPADISPFHRVDWDGLMTRLTQRIFSGNLMDLTRSPAAEHLRRPMAVAELLPGGGGAGLALGTIVLVFSMAGIVLWTLWRLLGVFGAKEGSRSRRLWRVLLFLLLWPVTVLSRWIGLLMQMLRKLPGAGAAVGDSGKQAGRKPARRSQFKRPSRNLHTVRRLFRALVQRAARADMPRRSHSTAREFTAQLSDALPEVHEALESMARSYEYVRYAPRPALPRDRLSFVRRQWRRIMEALK